MEIQKKVRWKSAGKKMRWEPVGKKEGEMEIKRM